MKKPSLLHMTAIIMIGVCLYSIISNLGSLSYVTGLSRTYAKSAVSSFILNLTILSLCGIVAAVGLYFYKEWARWLTIGFAALFLIQSLPGVFFVFWDWRNIINYVQYIVYAVFGIWCVYYLNRSVVEEEFRKTKTSISSRNFTVEENNVTQPRGIKVTSILLIIICIVQILYFLPVVKIISSISDISMGNVFWLLNTITILWTMLSAMGIVAGIGLIQMKKWARKVVLIFAVMSVALYGFGALISLGFRGLGFGFVIILVFGWALPIWSLYYFTRPHITIWFATK
jgi:hypothetical protein